jgi:16S rRNA (cytidine1402-2'-O)-methyltransferase
MKTASLFLFPSSLNCNDLSKQLPEYNARITEDVDYYIVEDFRSARRFLKRLNPALNIDGLEYAELNEHTQDKELINILQPLLNGKDAILISEAGLPCVADPGGNIVFMAHQLGIKVVPLVGPSSLMLALMGSGFNGQNFAFHGYLPIDRKERSQKLKELETLTWKNNQTQIFIETPYRNRQMIESVITTCRADSRLCVAANLLSPDEMIISKSVKEWRNVKTDFHKKPAVFLLYF